MPPDANNTKRWLLALLVAAGLPSYDLDHALTYATVEMQQHDGTQRYKRTILLSRRRLRVATANARAAANQANTTNLLERLRNPERAS